MQPIWPLQQSAADVLAPPCSVQACGVAPMAVSMTVPMIAT